MVEPREEYKTIESYTIARYKSDYVLKLDMNENTLGCSPQVLKAIQSITARDLAQYPTYGEIEAKVAATLQLPPENILVTNGGDAGINAVYSTYVYENDEVIYAVPSYVMYKIDAQRVKAKIVTVPYEEKWVYPVENVIKHITDKTKLIVICSPANPTGDVVAEKDICKILEVAPQTMVLLDEAYWRFTNRENKSLKHLINKYENLVIMHTFSKDYGLAGIRMGYLISQEKNFKQIHKSMDPFAVNVIANITASVAMDDLNFVYEYVDHVKESKKYVLNTLNALGYEAYSSEANFVLFYVGSKQEWYHSKLLKKKIKIRRYPTNPALDGYIRLTLGTVDQMQLVMEQFKPYESIIFDIDGVLVDESQTYRKAIKYTCQHFSGQEISYEQIQEYKNQGGFNNDWVLTKHILNQTGVDVSMEDIIEKFQELYFNDGKGFISEEKLLVPRELIERLSKKYKLNVFTGRPRPEAEFILKKAGIRYCFDTIIAMDDVPKGKGKPDSWGIEAICEKLQSRHVLYIGDMVDDVIASEKAGVDFAGILPPQDKSEMLRNLLMQEGAIEVYDNLEEAIYRIFSETV
jgi:histidinol-phosphate aminotransferase